MSGDRPPPDLHRLLTRQLRRLGIDGTPDDGQWADLLAVVSRAYAEADEDRYTLERSIEVSSTEMRDLHDQLRRRAEEDPLTGLPNRVALVHHLGQSLARARAGGPGVAALFIDLDGFKAVNDRLGHAAGDDLLVVVAARLAHCLRPDDVLARLGGDEFVVVCSDGGDRGPVLALARRLRESVSRPVQLACGPAQVGASLGVALTRTGRESAEELLQRADAAMYSSKQHGKGRVTLAEGAVPAVVPA
ncbi:GGDEF domain-containing protein [Klenkia terrae]|uniref:GGDEF domain-containing protein n=1 Tax=Klenkia terrae TaxID=1052259 RepID=A0ABU8E7J7_9ACTN|nr:GGDEF domain-containing protein [Klenkia terrae]